MMIYRDEETYHIFEDPKGENENQEFEFKDSYWDEMEAILNEHDSKKKKRRGAFFWISTSSLITFTLIGIYLFQGGTRSFDPPSMMNSASLNQNSTLINQTENQNFSSFNQNTFDSMSKINSDFTSVGKTSKSIRTKNYPVSVKKDYEDKHEGAKNVQNNAVVSNEVNDNINEVNSKSVDTDISTELTPMKKIEMSTINKEASNSIVFEKRKSKFRLQHSLYTSIEAGIVNKYNPSKGISYGVLAGLGYELGFHKKLAFQAGLNLQYREGVNQQYSNESRVYGFKSTRYYQNVSYKGQLNIEIPLALKVRFRRSSITAGVGTSFLLLVRSELEELMPESSQVDHMKSNFGVREGIRNIDVNLNLNYAYAVSPRIEVSAGISAGMLDQTANDFFGNEIKDHNLQFRVGLKYFFFNK